MRSDRRDLLSSAAEVSRQRDHRQIVPSLLVVLRRASVRTATTALGTCARLRSGKNAAAKRAVFVFGGSPSGDQGPNSSWSTCRHARSNDALFKRCERQATQSVARVDTRGCPTPAPVNRRAPGLRSTRARRSPVFRAKGTFRPPSNCPGRKRCRESRDGEELTPPRQLLDTAQLRSRPQYVRVLPERRVRPPSS